MPALFLIDDCFSRFICKKLASLLPICPNTNLQYLGQQGFSTLLLGLHFFYILLRLNACNQIIKSQDSFGLFA